MEMTYPFSRFEEGADKSAALKGRMSPYSFKKSVQAESCISK